MISKYYIYLLLTLGFSINKPCEKSNHLDNSIKNDNTEEKDIINVKNTERSIKNDNTKDEDIINVKSKKLSFF